MSDSYKLKSKLFAPKYSTGNNVLEGWEAQPVGVGQFQVIRADGTTRDMMVGQVIDGAGEVAIDEFNNLTVGKHSVLVGTNIAHGFEARKSRGKSYRVFGTNGTSYGVLKPGDKAGELGEAMGGSTDDEFQIGETGLPEVGGSTLPISHKVGELNLLVFSERDAAGYSAYFNVISPGSSTNRRDGVKGVFYQSPDGKRPAVFCEKVEGDDYRYRTAVIWPTKNPKYASVKIRTLEEAIEEREVYQSLADLNAIIEESDDADGMREVLSEEIEALDKRLEKANKDWASETFSVGQGSDFLFAKGRRVSQSNKPQQQAASCEMSP